MGAAVPGTGPNRETEVDTTIFRRRDAASDGLGRTKGAGENDMGMMESVMAMSGSTLPQVSSDGGHIAMTYHIVTTVCDIFVLCTKALYRLSLACLLTPGNYRMELVLSEPLLTLPPPVSSHRAKRPMLLLRSPAEMATFSPDLLATIYLEAVKAAAFSAL